MIVKEKVKDTKTASVINSVKENILSNFRVYFFCSVCGKPGNAGKYGKDKKSTSFIDSIIDYVADTFTTAVDDQGGYPLQVTNKTVLNFLKYVGCVLFALEIATTIAGVPSPKFSKLLEDLPKSEHLTKFVRKLWKNQATIYGQAVDGLQNNLKSSGSEESKTSLSTNLTNNNNQPNTPQKQRASIDPSQLAQLDANDSFFENDDDDNDDDDDGDGDDGDDNDVTNIDDIILTSNTNQNQVDQTDKIIKFWLQKKPKITYDHMKAVQDLFHEVKDPKANKVGLVRCLGKDGTSAWVCKDDDQDTNNESKVGNDPKRQSCYDLYEEKGLACCLYNFTDLK